ncbi:hypothetical protein [Phaeovulum sp. W22_SRMD_FR3]|uniref:hypothetical protein n=1 Tax=Phaeovulum sp. W22_SRMD_FR3 TaxID=3240274 RepID=UPI003F9551C1
MDTIARVHGAFHVQGWSMKRIVRDLHVSRNTVAERRLWAEAVWKRACKVRRM